MALVFSWCGFVFDTNGTTLMGFIAGNFEMNLHGLTGLLAIVLMAIHAVWVSMVLIRLDEVWLKRFTASTSLPG